MASVSAWDRRFGMAGNSHGRVAGARREQAGEADTDGSRGYLGLLSFVLFWRGPMVYLSHCNHNNDTKLKNRKTYGSVLVRFFRIKCILHPFFDLLKRLATQPARHEPFTGHKKTGRLYDTDAFSSSTASADFLHNLFNINGMALKSARTERRQKRVTYNNMPCAKPEKRTLLEASGSSQFLASF
jgi:hypothetical protein